MPMILAFLCMVAYIQVFIILAFALRLMPTLLQMAGQCLRLFLFISYRLYRMLLTPLARILRRRTGLDLTAGLLRLLSTTLLSLIVGFIIIAVTPLTMSLVTVGTCLIHGLAVGIIWDDVEHPGMLNLGARLQ